MIALTAARPAQLVDLLRGDRDVVAVERNRTRRLAAEPDAEIDPDTGLSYGWAFDAVRAGPALNAVGGGSDRIVAVLDSGLDIGHDDLAHLRGYSYNVNDGSTDVSDFNGHGTFVTGLIAMGNTNGIGGRGVAGDTPLLAIRGTDDSGSFPIENILAGLEWAVENEAAIVNMSLAGEGLDESEARGLSAAFFSDVLPVAAAGNEAQQGNPIGYPAAFVGGRNGAVNIGLSVAASQPDGSHAPFSNHNAFISLAAPGGAPEPHKGVYSTIPRNENSWDHPGNPSQITANPGESRWAYGQGTSFAAPIVAAVAALAWKAEPRLASEQVVQVMQESAQQPDGSDGWNEFLGHGIVDAPSALAAASSFDVIGPSFVGKAKRTSRFSNRVRVRVDNGVDAADGGDPVAGGVTYALANIAGGLRILMGPTSNPIAKTIKLRRKHKLVALACDANQNCTTKRLGTFPVKRRRRG